VSDNLALLARAQLDELRAIRAALGRLGERVGDLELALRYLRTADEKLDRLLGDGGRFVSNPVAVSVNVSDSVLRIVLADGRELAAPLAWYPRLRDATPEQRENWRPISQGRSIYWPDLDLDVSVAVLLGLPS
jgi:hypothetical protein